MQTKDLTHVSHQSAEGNRRTDRASPDQRAPAQGPASTSGAAQDTVTISERATTLQGLLESAGTPPRVDTQRVEALKTAIGEGRYEIDAQRIAAKLIELETQL